MDKALLRKKIIKQLQNISDPEIPVNIYDLGLIYKLEIDGATGCVDIAMTLTSAACPVAQSFPGKIETCLRQIHGVNEVHVELVWEPAWSKEHMSLTAKLQLNIW